MELHTTYQVYPGVQLQLRRHGQPPCPASGTLALSTAVLYISVCGNVGRTLTGRLRRESTAEVTLRARCCILHFYGQNRCSIYTYSSMNILRANG